MTIESLVENVRILFAKEPGMPPGQMEGLSAQQVLDGVTCCQKCQVAWTNDLPVKIRLAADFKEAWDVLEQARARHVCRAGRAQGAN